MIFQCKFWIAKSLPQMMDLFKCSQIMKVWYNMFPLMLTSHFALPRAPKLSARCSYDVWYIGFVHLLYFECILHWEWHDALYGSSVIKGVYFQSCFVICHYWENSAWGWSEFIYIIDIYLFCNSCEICHLDYYFTGSHAEDWRFSCTSSSLM